MKIKEKSQQQQPRREEDNNSNSNSNNLNHNHRSDHPKQRQQQQPHPPHRREEKDKEKRTKVVEQLQAHVNGVQQPKQKPKQQHHQQQQQRQVDVEVEGKRKLKNDDATTTVNNCICNGDTNTNTDTDVNATAKTKAKANGDVDANADADTASGDKDKDPTCGEEDPAGPTSSEKVLYDNRIKRKNVLALNEKVAAIREYEKMPVYKRIGRMFNCSPDQIKRIVQQKESILRAWEQRTRRCQDAKTLQMKVVRVSMLGRAVYDWIRRMMYYKDFMITDGLIQKMALQFKSAMGLQNFFPHQDWCDRFRETYHITSNDSKNLKIAYKHGHSVQIRDVMKDVLNECTPDLIGEEDDTFVNKDVMKWMDENENENGRREAVEKMAMPRIANTKAAAAAERRLNGQQPRPEAKQNGTVVNGGIGGTGDGQSRAVPHLQPIRKLVALPLKTSGPGGVNMSQKVLVATPITSNGSIPGASPMTMTIIPLATIAQGKQHQPTAGACEKPTVPAPRVEIKKEKCDEPPMVKIKQEIISEDETEPAPVSRPPEPRITKTAARKEREEVAAPPLAPRTKRARTATSKLKTAIENAKELDEQMDCDDMALSSLRRFIQSQSGKTSEMVSVISTAPALSPISIAMPVKTNIATNVVNDGTTTTTTTKMPTASVLKSTGITTHTHHNESIAKRTARMEAATVSVSVSTPKSLPALSPASLPMSSSSPLSPIPPMPTLTKAPTLLPSSPSPPPTPTLLPCPAITSTSALQNISALDTDTESSCASTATGITVIAATRASTSGGLTPKSSLQMNRRKPQTNLSSIKSCGEARRYLKLIEDFALVKENFRLIGLITRADEVLREMDGSDDIEID